AIIQKVIITDSMKNFVAINYITCEPEYKERFEELFGTRAKAIDRMPGFVDMQVLRPLDGQGDYLVVSHWESEDAFKQWTTSPEFPAGHKRGFADIKAAKERGEKAPMESKFKTYAVIAR